MSIWDISDGLPGNSIWAITQTHDGYVWLTTTRGLAKFNGFDFTVFETSKFSGATDECVGLYLDLNKDLLVALVLEDCSGSTKEILFL